MDARLWSTLATQAQALGQQGEEIRVALKRLDALEPHLAAMHYGLGDLKARLEALEHVREESLSRKRDWRERFQWWARQGLWVAVVGPIVSALLVLLILWLIHR